jgi:endoglucanase
MPSRKEIPSLLLALICLLSGPAFSQPAITPPLHTEGRRIIDALGHPVRLTSVNWYGFDQKEFVAGGLDHAPLSVIIDQIHQIGVNSVRLPWANETLEHDPPVPDYAVAANPQFKGKHAMAVMNAVIDALARAHIMVILDNHVSRADWCCSETDGNGLWYNNDYPESSWLADWRAMAARYRHQPWVVGADLRNELRNGATWGGADPKLDWHLAAERGGEAVLVANPQFLVFVESPDYSTNFAGFDKLPVKLPVRHRLVYSPHAYYNGKQTPSSFEELKRAYDQRTMFLLHTEPAVPLWVGEFGACQTLTCGEEADWFRNFIRLLQENPQISWSYWPLNGTQSSGITRKYDTLETFGLLTTDYRHMAAPKIIDLFGTIETQPAR